MYTKVDRKNAKNDVKFTIQQKSYEFERLKIG